MRSCYFSVYSMPHASPRQKCPSWRYGGVLFAMRMPLWQWGWWWQGEIHEALVRHWVCLEWVH